MLRIGAQPSYLMEVLPAVTVFGLGLSLTVAPLTATVLGATDPRFAGIASGVNNAVARAGSLLAVAVLPLAAGLRGGDYQRPDSFAAGFQVATLVSAGLLAAGALTAAFLIRNEGGLRQRGANGGLPAEVRPPRVHCPVAGPTLQPAPAPSAGVPARDPVSSPPEGR
jgi:hypothetical protein